MVQAWNEQQDTSDTVPVDLADNNLRVSREPGGTVDAELVEPTLQQREGAGDLELVELELRERDIPAVGAPMTYADFVAGRDVAELEDGQDGIVMKKNMDQKFIADPNHTKQLVEIGFSHSEAHQALITSRGDIDVAIDKLLSGNARQ